MPVVHVYLWKGRTKQQKSEIISGITNVFIKQNVPKDATHVIIHDVLNENWGIAGESCEK